MSVFRFDVPPFYPSHVKHDELLRMRSPDCQTVPLARTPIHAWFGMNPRGLCFVIPAAAALHSKKPAETLS